MQQLLRASYICIVGHLLPGAGDDTVTQLHCLSLRSSVLVHIAQEGVMALGRVAGGPSQAVVAQLTIITSHNKKCHVPRSSSRHKEQPGRTALSAPPTTMACFSYNCPTLLLMELGHGLYGLMLSTSPARLNTSAISRADTREGTLAKNTWSH